MISKEEVKTKVNNRDQFHSAMIANGYYIPSAKSSFCTLKFMQEVRAKECFCPLLKDITFLPCVHPPTTSQLVDGITDMLENNGNYEDEEQARKYKRLAVHIRRNAPEKQWLIGLLGSL